MTTPPDPTPALAAPEPREIRDDIARLVRADLVGPLGGPDEELEQRPGERYIVGTLAPRDEVLAPEKDEDLEGAAEDEDAQGPSDAGSASRVTVLPQSFGLTFAVDRSCSELKFTARWGRYEKGPSSSIETPTGKPKTVWLRRPFEATSPAVSLADGPLDPWVPDAERSGVRVTGRVRARESQWIVTVFLVNEQEAPEVNRDEAWLFQCELEVHSADGSAAFIRRPIERVGSAGDPAAAAEERELAMLHRHDLEFAVGHGVSVEWTLAESDPSRATSVRTESLPSYDVARMDPVTAKDEERLATLELDMRVLGESRDEEFAARLEPLIAAYADWIKRQRKRIEGGEDQLEPHADVARAAMAKADAALERMRAGIQLLGGDALAAEAFRYANRAMALQRERGWLIRERRKGVAVDESNIPATERGRWYPFQLAFILLNLPSLTDLHHPDRSDPERAAGDLLWFPTGGGKTEAYLGLAAYAMVLRRLQGPIEGHSGEHGVAVLMRYTLRLLTVQQYQRAAALMCALEWLRRDAQRNGDTRLGATPFRIGLWVGGTTTPNSTRESDESVTRARRQQGEFHGVHALQITRCPWCGSKLSLRSNVHVETYARGRARTVIACSDSQGLCPFTMAQAPGEGLPLLSVDEEIYRNPPALLIATVDKFARMPWAGATQTLFGRVDGLCPRHGFRSPELEDASRHNATGGHSAVQTRAHGPLRPPDLVIQDELHLISGPLGSLVGLYETALDELASWTVNGRRVRPKLVASTATIRRADQQMRDLFVRRLEVFPPHGLDVSDNFFARRRPVHETPGRRYMGICAPGRRVKNTYIRAYLAAMLAAQTEYEQWDKNADPWMTLVGYFNTLRDLGGMRRVVEDDVRTRLEQGDRLGFRRRLRPNVRELTSRLPSSQIPVVLDDLELQFSAAAAEERRERAKRNEFAGPAPVDVLLATSMVSVGVDVPRLGLMVVAGQPKTTSEYIQATSRVGRRHPGLVLVALNWARPRDLSHYERFRQFHATFYRHVEALSVTPFAPRALDRGLSGVLVSLVRLRDSRLNANEQAQAFSRDDAHVQVAREAILRRVEAVTGQRERVEQVRDMIDSRLDEWSSRVRRAALGSQLGYDARRDGSTTGLLRQAELGERDPFTCLGSLRDVEPGVPLLLDDYQMDALPPEGRA
ncbi:MAG: helicase [Candidatus Eisenbacteria bacterium]|uniref:Helicase n=1 Tax=Eiseniibacteriota bacterium TaxID=2212470 RepID=A0A933S927_UNCEI|nr:helicase [Candidatus Eisenbacteria bacterium]